MKYTTAEIQDRIADMKAQDRETTADAAKTEAERALALLDEAREAYDAFKTTWSEVGRAMRSLNRFEYERVDAYPGWQGTRDAGAGTSLEGWMDEVEESLNEISMGPLNAD